MAEGLNRQSARDEHVERFPARLVPRSEFDLALLKLLRLSPRSGADGLRDGRRRAMVQALDCRASYDQIRHWRRGRRRAPQWAIELLTRQLDSMADASQLLKSKTAGD